MDGAGRSFVVRLLELEPMGSAPECPEEMLVSCDQLGWRTDMTLEPGKPGAQPLPLSPWASESVRTSVPSTINTINKAYHLTLLPGLQGKPLGQYQPRVDCCDSVLALPTTPLGDPWEGKGEGEPSAIGQPGLGL